jgi:hypothetical protein
LRDPFHGCLFFLLILKNNNNNKIKIKKKKKKVFLSSYEGLKLDFYKVWLDVLFYCVFQWRGELGEDETMRETKKRKYRKKKKKKKSKSNI